MGSTIFILVSKWAFDHNNTEISTITMEDYEFESINGVENLSPSNMPDDLKFVIKQIKKAQDRSVRGVNELVGLYQITNNLNLLKIQRDPNKDHHIAFDMKPICKFDEKSNPIPF